ncbi:MAG: hypothetical protein P1V35_16830 [Planctomycetota bacterium]|nr:hypothetical protein [Planctomycetota bacterium]
MLVPTFSSASTARAQIQAAPTVINMDVHASIDEIGNGEVKLTIKMNAMQWAEWKSEYGNNPSLFKRDISKQFNQIELTDFKLDQDDMKRQAVVTIQGKGMAIYQGDGVYEVELDGEMTGGDLVDDEFRVTYTEPQGPSVLTLIDQRVRLPKGAQKIEVTKNSMGDDVLRYEFSQPSGGLPWGWIGIVFALLGGGLFFTAGSDSRA